MDPNDQNPPDDERGNQPPPAGPYPSGPPGGYVPPPGQPAPGYPQGGYPPPPPGYGQPPPKRRRFPLWLGIGLGVLGLCCLGGIIAVVTSVSKSNDSKSGSGGQQAASSAGVGQPVRDGKFEFTVNKMTCGVDHVGTSDLGQTAQGQFCLISLTVKNIGDKPQTLSDTAQKAFSSDGNQYAADGAADLYANNNNQVWLNSINPGNQIQGVIAYDIPASAKLTKVELHDSPFSRGATVSVS